MSAWQIARRTLGVLAAVALVFGAGLFVGSHGGASAPVVRELPLVGVKPKPDLLIQDGKSCDLYRRYPDGEAFHKDEGCPIKVGPEFTIGFHTVDAGWTIKPGADGPVMTVTVRNANPGAIAGFWHTFHLNRYDGSLTEIVWCDSKAPFAAGEVRAITCKPLNPEGNAPYDSMAIS